MRPPYAYPSTVHNGRIVKTHIAKAEIALGRKLPPGAVVHHIDGNGWNNANSNLAIFPSQEYHLMIHVRQRALEATGDPNKVPCHICKKWDSPESMYFRKSRPGQWHRKCAQVLREARRRRSIEKEAA